MFLALSGAGLANGLLPVLFPGDDFTITHSAGRIQVLVGNVNRWTIDPAQFGPRARTHVERGRDGFEIRLSQAVFPGTQLPADLRCVLTRGTGVWKMQLENALGMTFMADWLDWLERNRPATARWNVGHLRPMETLKFALRQGGNVCFTPDWVFSAGALLLEVEGLPRLLECDTIEWRLSEFGELGTQAQGAPATVFRFARGTSCWKIPLRREHNDGWKLDHDDSLELFDELRVEAGSAAGGTLQSALLTGSHSDDATLRLVPAAGLRTIDDAPFHIALTRPRIVFSLGEPEVKSVFLADAVGEETWAHTDTVSLRFGVPGEPNVFELQSSNDTSTVITAPSLTALHVPAPDTNIRLTFKDGKAPFFQWSHFVQPFERAIGIVGTPPWERALAFDLTCGDVLTVVRPADMLKLEFEFQDMVLHTGFSPHVKPAHGSSGPGTPSAPGWVTTICHRALCRRQRFIVSRRELHASRSGFRRSMSKRALSFTTTTRFPKTSLRRASERPRSTA